VCPPGDKPLLYPLTNPENFVNYNVPLGSCLARFHSIRNIYKENFSDILSSQQKMWLQKKAETSSSCVDSGVIESSMFWDFKPEILANNSLV
jgi:hypothetical protein